MSREFVASCSFTYEACIIAVRNVFLSQGALKEQIRAQDDRYFVSYPLIDLSDGYFFFNTAQTLLLEAT
jgi:hypothetical protein